MAFPYQSKLTRRESLKWLGALSASTLIPNVALASIEIKEFSGHWPTLSIKPITATGYGKDPNLIVPPTSPWPKTLTQAQLNLVSVLADILVPSEGSVPSASQVGVPDVVDEWVSAPYSRQQYDRETILSVLMWIDDESKIKFNSKFIDVSKDEQLAIIDSIAYDSAANSTEFARPYEAFSRFRSLILAGFFCSPQGTKDLGYLGNVPIAGDYPGPTPEAMVHLTGVLEELGLTL